MSADFLECCFCSIVESEVVSLFKHDASCYWCVLMTMTRIPKSSVSIASSADVTCEISDFFCCFCARVALGMPSDWNACRSFLMLDRADVKEFLLVLKFMLVPVCC